MVRDHPIQHPQSLSGRERADRHRGGERRADRLIVADAYEDLDAFQLAAAYAGIAPRFFSGTLVPDYRDQP